MPSGQTSWQLLQADIFHGLFNTEISIGHTIDPRRISQYLPGAISLLQPVL
jgi:hypothetical protein